MKYRKIDTRMWGDEKFRRWDSREDLDSGSSSELDKDRIQEGRYWSEQCRKMIYYCRENFPSGIHHDFRYITSKPAEQNSEISTCCGIITHRRENCTAMSQYHRRRECYRVEMRDIACTDAFDQRNSATEVDELTAKNDWPVVDRFHHIFGERAVGEDSICNVGRCASLERHFEKNVDEPMDRGHVGSGLDNSKVVETVDHTSRVAAHCRHRSANECTPHLGLHSHDHSEVEQHKPAIVSDEKISRMRIGVEQSVYQHHLDVCFDD